MNKYGVGILAAVMIAALVMPAVAAGQATVDQRFIYPQCMTISGYVHDCTMGSPIPDATVVLVFFGDAYEYASPEGSAIGSVSIATTTTDENGFYWFGYNEMQGYWNWDIYAYPFSPALIFAYAEGYEASQPQVILLTNDYYHNIFMYSIEA